MALHLWPNKHVIQGALTNRENHSSGKKENKVQLRAAITSMKMVVHGIHMLQEDGRRRWLDGTAETIPLLQQMLKDATNVQSMVYTPGAAAPGIFKAICQLEPHHVRFLQGPDQQRAWEELGNETTHRQGLAGPSTGTGKSAVPGAALGGTAEDAHEDTHALAGDVELLDPKDIARLVVELLGDRTDTPLQSKIEAHSERLLSLLREAAREPGNDYVAIFFCAQFVFRSRLDPSLSTSVGCQGRERPMPRLCFS